MPPTPIFLVLPLLATLQSPQVPPPAEAPGGAVSPEPTTRRAEAREALLSRLLPQPMARPTFESWLDELGIVDGDRDRADDLYAAYRFRWDQAVRQHGTRMLAEVNAAYTYRPEQQSMAPRYTPEYLELLDRRAACMEALRAAEQELGNAMVALAGSDLQYEARRLAFDRFFVVASEPVRHPSAGRNLVALVGEIGLTDEELAALAATLDDYVRKMMPVLEWRSRSLAEAERDLAELQVTLGPEWALTATPEVERLVQEELDALAETVRRTELPPRGINRETLTALARLLRPDRAALLRDRFYRDVAPELFDDERALASIVKLSAQMPDIGAEDAEARLDLLLAAQTRLLPLGIEAADLADEALSMLSDDPLEAERRLALRSRMLELAIERRALLADTARGLQALLTADEATMMPQIEAYLADLANRDAADRWTIGRYRERLAELRLPPPPAPVVPQPDEDGMDAADEMDDEALNEPEPRGA